jgi:hypothetical protein
MEINYVCLNPDCDSKKPKTRTYKTSRGSITKYGTIDKITIEKEESDENEKECPHCKTESLKPIGADGIVLFNSFSVLSKEGRTEVLKKRSRDHYKSNGEMKDRVRDLNERSGG